MRAVAVNGSTLTISLDSDREWGEPCVVLDPVLTWRDYLRWSNEWNPWHSTRIYINGRRVG